MLQITPQMKILVAVEPADFRRGIDGLARLCQETLQQDPFVGTVFVTVQQLVVNRLLKAKDAKAAKTA